MEILKESYMRPVGTEILLLAYLLRYRDVDVLLIWRAGVGEVEGAEVMHLHLDVAADHVDMDVNFCVHETCEDVPVLLVGFEVVRHEDSFQEFNFGVLGDCIDVHFGLSYGCEFDEQSAFVARFEGELIDFFGEGNSSLIVGFKLVDATINLAA